MLTTNVFYALASLVTNLSLTSALHAQVRASQHGIVAQTVDSTTIRVEYFRPIARGRLLFGGVVPWGHMWTPGANWATTLDVDRPVFLMGEPLRAGKYSVWLIPRVDIEWTLVLSRSAILYHTQPPLPEEDQLRVLLKPQVGTHAEVLTWSFPAVAADRTTLQMQWGVTLLRIPIVVGPSNQP